MPDDPAISEKELLSFDNLARFVHRATTFPSVHLVMEYRDMLGELQTLSVPAEPEFDRQAQASLGERKRLWLLIERTAGQSAAFVIRQGMPTLTRRQLSKPA